MLQHRRSAVWHVGFLVLVSAAAVVSAMLGVSPAWAEIPHKINYQGLLLNKSTGEPLEGAVSITFGLYWSPAGGTAEWSETQTATPDSNGVFSVVLGSTNPIHLGFDAPVWLELTVAGEVLSPRRELVSVPYAFRAARVDSVGGVPAVDVWTVANDGSGSGLDADLLDGLDASALAPAVHAHDDRYYTENELNEPGAVNLTENPVDWTKLKSVPDGLADGVDHVGAGDGYSLDAFDGDPSDVVFVDGEGRVGVGTSTPGRKLHVASEGARVLVEATAGNAEINLKTAGDDSGDIWAIYKHVTDGDLHFFRGADRVTVQSATGNVGIGTANPAAKLDVSGAVNAASEYMIGGKDVLAVRDTNNLYVGLAAGANNSGHSVVCIGDSAGYSNTGYSCTFVGVAAGMKNTMSYNAFVGDRAGASNEDGDLNAFFGSRAGERNTRGSANTFIGAATGGKNTIGGSNTFVGEAAGTENIGGWANTFVGRLAGMSNVGGSKNSFFGHYAGWKCASGDSNVYIGEEAGAYNVIGSGNVFLGHQAGFKEMGSNKLYIANSHLASNVLIYGDFATGRIGLGTTDPERKLHIVGEGPRILIESTAGNPELNFENTDDASAQRWAIYKHSTTDDLRFYQNGDRVTIQNGTGNVGIGTTDPGAYKLYVNGTACGTSAWGTCSDTRYKRDVAGISGALSKVLDMRGVSFEWRSEDFADKGFPAGRHYGVIAQEVEQVLPEAVGSGADGGKTVVYDELIPVLIESIKELKAHNDALEARIASLEDALSEASLRDE